MSLQKQTYSNAIFLHNKELGYFPRFTYIIDQRLNMKKPVNVAIVGEAGIGKSYMAWTLAKLSDKKFTVDQIVYTYAEYMTLIKDLGLGRAIVFDEPSYAMSKRDWYQQLNKVLVKTMESQRFKLHPLFIPVINLNLLDKTVRDYLIQFLVDVYKRTPHNPPEQRGYCYAHVYRLFASQREPKVYYYYQCTLKYPMLGKCPRDSCIGCRELKDCKEFRAQYERKKLAIQDMRYEEGAQEAAELEAKELTDQQIEAILVENFKEQIINNKGKPDATFIRSVLFRERGIKVGWSRAYTIKKLLERDYPTLFSMP
ncbi:MAG: hypothetical protein ACUVT9_05465 [Candidatus Bathycorpusculaceae bacterium]